MLIGDCGLLSTGTLGDNEKTNLSFGPQDSYEQVKGSTDMWKTFRGKHEGSRVFKLLFVSNITYSLSVTKNQLTFCPSFFSIAVMISWQQATCREEVGFSLQFQVIFQLCGNRSCRNLKYLVTSYSVKRRVQLMHMHVNLVYYLCLSRFFTCLQFRTP